MYIILVGEVYSYDTNVELLDNKLFKTKEEATKYLFNHLKSNEHMNFDLVNLLDNDQNWYNLDEDYKDYKDYIKNIVEIYETLYSEKTVSKIHENIYEENSDFMKEKYTMLETILHKNDPDKYISNEDDIEYLDIYQKSKNIKDSDLVKEFLNDNPEFILGELSKKELEDFNWNYIKPLFVKGNKITIPNFSSVNEFKLVKVNY